MMTDDDLGQARRGASATPRASDAPALETRGLWKNFGAIFVARGIDFRLAQCM